MRIKMVFKIFPAFVFYWNACVLKQHQATARGPFIFIRPTSKDDLGLLEHELVHVKFFYKFPIINPLLTMFSEKWRIKTEIAAYTKQLSFCDDFEQGVKIFGKYLSTRYGFHLTQSQAENLLLTSSQREI
jgi:hypothetical protein